MKGKIALYSRVSTSEQSEHGYSERAGTTTHQRVMKNFPGYDYETYTDSGISGKILKVVRQ